MLVQCSSSLVMPVDSPSVSLPICGKEGFLFPAALLDHVLLHWLSGPGHANFFLRVVGDGPSREMQLDSASWQNGNHQAICVRVSCHAVPRKFVGIDIQLCGEGQLFTRSLLVLVPFDVQHSRAGSDWQQVASGPNLGQHINQKPGWSQEFSSILRALRGWKQPCFCCRSTTGIHSVFQ